MLKALKRALGAALREGEPVPAQERRQLELAVAVLVHEARRADYVEGDARESDAGVSALCDIFSLERAQAAELFAQGREKAQHLTSFYPPVTTIKREFSMPERIRLVEHLWRVSFADGRLDYYEDHYLQVALGQ